MEKWARPYSIPLKKEKLYIYTHTHTHHIYDIKVETCKQNVEPDFFFFLDFFFRPK